MVGSLVGLPLGILFLAPHVPGVAIKLVRADRVEEHAARMLEEAKVVARLGDQYVKVAKVLGEFVWHAHEHEDELFLILRGSLRIQFEDGEVTLGPGDVFVVPAGVRHNPVAEEECSLLLFEPASTVNTGSAGGDRTVVAPVWI